MESDRDVEQRILRVLAGVAVFWSFFVGISISVNAVKGLVAYANEPMVQAHVIERQAAAMQATLRARQHQEHASSTEERTNHASSSTSGNHWRDSNGSSTLSKPAKTLHCPRPSQSLTRGGRNKPEEVRQLQQFLAERYAQRMEDLVTGHFGPLTERLIARFQEEHGLPPAGSVGPLTRAAILRECGYGGTGSTTTAAVLRASPATGTAPLLVTFTVTTGAGNYTLVFGDGATTTVAIPAIQCVTTPCTPPSQTVTHTYVTGGTYNASLTGQLAPQTLVGTTTVVVSPSS